MNVQHLLIHLRARKSMVAGPFRASRCAGLKGFVVGFIVGFAGFVGFVAFVAFVAFMAGVGFVGVIGGLSACRVCRVCRFYRVCRVCRVHRDYGALYRVEDVGRESENHYEKTKQSST